MKLTSTFLLYFLLVAGCRNNPQGNVRTAHFVPGPLPSGWAMETTMDSEQFMPLRGLTKPIAQVTLTKSSMSLPYELAPGRRIEFYPNLVLLVFSIADLDKTEKAVRKEALRSDYPPIVFGATKEHILVTSPGYRGMRAKPDFTCAK